MSLVGSIAQLTIELGCAALALPVVVNHVLGGFPGHRVNVVLLEIEFFVGGHLDDELIFRFLPVRQRAQDRTQLLRLHHSSSYLDTAHTYSYLNP